MDFALEYIDTHARSPAEQERVLGALRLFALGDYATEVLKLVDGQRTLDKITGLLSQKYQATAVEIASNVRSMLDDLVTKGAIQL